MVKRGNFTGMVIVSLFIISLLISGCERASSIPPPESALAVVQNVREGYNAEDVDLFCNDFSDIMFTKGFTRRAYLDVIQGLRKKFGAWESEVYLGEEKGAYIWRVKFETGRAKLVLVFNDSWQVIGLWFR